MSKIIFVEDDKNVYELIDATLKLNGFEVKGYYEPREFLNNIKKERPDLVLLDLMLPYMYGMDVLKVLKDDNETRNIPVIILTAKNLEDDIVEGLDKGASDYITKPFGLKELVSRINSNLRKSHLLNDILTCDEIAVDTKSYIAKVNDHELDLTKKEFQILELLIKNRGIVVTRKELFRLVWGFEAQIHTRTLDMHIKTLRQKIALFSKFDYIQTVRGVGYVIR